jgi:predicted DNA-binding transcriptional regulator YafY
MAVKPANVSFREKDFNAMDYFKNTIGVISPQGKPPEIIFALKKRQAQYLITQPLHESQEIMEENEEEIIFKIKVHPTYELMTIFMGYGADLRLLEPEDIRKDFIEEIRKMLEQYQ